MGSFTSVLLGRSVPSLVVREPRRISGACTPTCRSISAVPTAKRRWSVAWGDADPDYIVINSRDVRKYGKRGLGSDYGLGVADWINRHDRVLRDFRTSDYLVRVFERNETASQLDGE